MTRDDPAHGTEADRPRQSGLEPPTVEASSLFGGSREVVIIHNGERYRLRLTQSGKLILTK